jgi:homoserine dehydrogenase
MEVDIPKVRVALAGFGTIGSALGRIISTDGTNRATSLANDPNSVSAIADTLAYLEVVAICTLEVDQVQKLLSEPDYSGIATAKVTNSFDELLDERPDIVVELIGGVEPAKSFILQALEHGISVVTANKAVLGLHGQQLRGAAKAKGVALLFEAAVGGAVPIVRTIRHSLMGDKILSIKGVLNGTTNFILDKMTHEGADYSQALQDAQKLGFAEADPTADVQGHDAAAKIAILASLAFGRNLTSADVQTEGITEITQGMIIAARNQGQVYKLVASATRDGCSDANDNIQLQVKPQLVPEKSAFGELSGSMNAVEVDSQYSTKLTLSGPGAGGDPTASAVLADIIEIAGALT